MNISAQPLRSYRRIEFVKASSTSGKIAISRIHHEITEVNHQTPILFLHGATVSSEFTCEYEMDGVSWMSYLLADGWASFGLDLPGYGRSDPYPDGGAQEVDPRRFGSAETVLGDIDNAVEWVLDKTSAEALHLVAISRGAIPAGYYTSRYPKKVQSLTLHAPITRKEGVAPEIIQELLGTPEVPKQPSFALSALDRFRLLESDRPSGTTTNLERSFIENWVQDYGRATPRVDGEDVGSRKIKTPIGFAVDIFDAWHGKYFDPRTIQCPTLILRGDWDKLLTPASETQILFEELGSEEKYYIQLPHSTHSMLFEKSRFDMYRYVSEFLGKF